MKTKPLTDEQIMLKNQEYINMAQSGELQSATALQILMDADGIPYPIQETIMAGFINYQKPENL
jgi:hypothetical protein